MPQHFLQSGLGDCVQKKGCVWHHVTHEQLNEDDLESSLRDHSGVAVLKFEPFILHVRCSSLEDARKLVSSLTLIKRTYAPKPADAVIYSLYPVAVLGQHS